MQTSLKHDEEGFLIGRFKAGLIDQKLQTVVDNTEATLKLLKGRVDGNRVIVSGRVRVTGMAANAANFGKKPAVAPVYRMAANQSPMLRDSLIRGGRRADGKDANKSLVKSIKAATPAAARMPLAKQGDQHLTKSELRRQRRQQAIELRESQKQTKLLKDIKAKSDSTSGLLKMLLPFLLGGGLLKSILKAPAAILGGKAAKGILRGADGKFIKGGAAAGGLAKGSFFKGLGRAGIIGALVSAWNGINVESSDLSREDKNKAHTKNLVVSAGGIGGAIAGAKAGALMGSVVPGWGTAVGGVVGGVLGGFGGAELTSLVIEKVDQVFPEGFGQMMGSWDGFVGGLKTLGAGAMGQMSAGTQYVYYEVLPSEVAIAMGTITGIGRDAWASITGFASDSWSEVTRLATPYYNAATQFASDAWTAFKSTVGPWFETIGGYAQSAFDTFSQLSGQFFTWLGNTWLGQQAGAAWDGVKSAANSVADWASEKYDKAADYVNSKKRQASQDYQAGKKGRGQSAGTSVAVGGAMVMGNVAAVNARGKQGSLGGELGSVSAKYEGRIDSANRDTDQNGNPAGWAYGKFQFNSAKGGLNRFFADNPAIAGMFTGLIPGTKAFNQKWKAVAKADPKGFEVAQNKSAENLWYKPARETYAKHGFDLNDRGVQEAVFSGSIQHGGMSTIKFKGGKLGVLGIAKRMAGGRDIRSLSPEEQIRLIYAARTEYHENGKSRYISEANDAISYSRNKNSGQKTNAIPSIANKVAPVAMAAPLLPHLNLGMAQKSNKAFQINPASVESMTKNVSIPVMAKSPTQQKPRTSGQSQELVATIDGSIAHMPKVSRSVTNKHIASIASGGIVMS
ncbi:hypothetical protein AB8Q18_08320 [Neisseriaceae bacterium CLB008]